MNLLGLLGFRSNLHTPYDVYFALKMFFEFSNLSCYKPKPCNSLLTSLEQAARTQLANGILNLKPSCHKSVGLWSHIQ